MGVRWYLKKHWISSQANKVGVSILSSHFAKALNKFESYWRARLAGKKKIHVKNPIIKRSYYVSVWV